MIELLTRNFSGLFLYALKTIACSGILYGFYYFFLRNQRWHEWNRFYLLFSMAVSIAVPWIRVPLLPAAHAQEITLTHSTPPAIVNGEFYEADQATGTPAIHWPGIVSYVYLFLTMVAFIFLLVALTRLLLIVINNPKKRMNGYTLIFTSEKNAPFSFFHFIFWNRETDLCEPAVKTILYHEQVHVRQWHSADKLFLQILHIFFWFNPFLWLTRKEIDMVHEFTADEYTSAESGAGELAGAMLASLFQSQTSRALINHFYSPSIKRRLFMLTKFNSKHYPATRWLFLPLLVLLFGAFTLIRKPAPQLKAARIFTVVIDAGHGGEDNGAKSPDGTTEKDIVLAIALAVKQQNNDPNLDIILTRNNDGYMSLKDKVDFTVRQHPDAFLSLHMNAGSSEKSGFDMFVNADSTVYSKRSAALGAALAANISTVYAISPQLKRRSNPGIWVLHAPQINYPGILLECGFIDNPKDLAFIKDPNNQRKVADGIIRALGAFAREPQ